MNRIRCSQALSVADLAVCVSTLKNGGVLCYPTETFYGLGIDPQNVKGRDRLYRIKGRTADKELPVIAADYSMVARFCDTMDPRVQRLASVFWPGPLTMVLRLRAGDGTLAVRVPGFRIARQIAEAFGAPVVSTSANISGESPVRDPDQLPGRILDAVDLLIDGGLTPGGAPSTIVTFSIEGVQILREGATPTVEVLRALNLH